MAAEALVTLGPYTIESTIGQGGMGIVYRAVDSNLGRDVAIKVLHPHLLRHENLKQRFRREARMHAKLMHPNIVTLLSLYEDESHMALVMELVEGSDLKLYLRNNPAVTLKEKLQIAIDVLSGLEAAHQYGMVHRDLKPANVLISKNGNAKLLDFGLAKPEQGDEDLTQSGATVGSFRYMAPEQILNNPIDARTDLYAFGILLFYMTVGRLPFDSTSNGGEFEIMEKQVREPAPAPLSLNGNIPPALSQLILRLLEKNKYERPDSAAAVKAEILTIKEQLQQPDKTVPVMIQEPDTFSSELTAIPSNQEIAQQWIQHTADQWKIFSARIKVSSQNFSNAFRHRLTGLVGITTVFILLGTLSITILNMAEKNATQHFTQLPQQVTKRAPVTPPPAAVTAKPEAKPVEAKTAAVAAEKKPEPVIEKKKPVKKKIVKKEPVPVTYSVKYTVTRSDDTKVKSSSKHEFKSGEHLFFPGLAEKGFFSSYEKGETVITFDKPVRLSKIIFHKASVGKKDFRDCYIYLELQGPDSNKWKTLFERKDKDLDTRLTFKRVYRHMKKIKSVRVRFKTYDPITIGPIDLYR